MSALTLQRTPAVPFRSVVVVVAAAAALVLLTSSLAGSAARPAAPRAPTNPAEEPVVVHSSPMIAAGLPVDTVVGGASPITPVAGPVDHVTAVGESAEAWPARPSSGTTAPSPAAVPEAAVPVDNQGPVASSDEVGLIPAAIAWRDAEGEIHQGLIGVDDIPAEVLGQPEGVVVGE